MIGSHNNYGAFNNLKLVGVLLALLMVFAGAPVMAQERNGIGQDENYNNNNKSQEELNSNSDSHLINNPANVNKDREVLRDSLVVKPTLVVNPKPDSSVPKKSEAEDETLSFNVLYFIIQKFKVSDMLN